MEQFKRKIPYQYFYVSYETAFMERTLLKMFTKKIFWPQIYQNGPRVCTDFLYYKFGNEANPEDKGTGSLTVKLWRHCKEARHWQMREVSSSCVAKQFES